MSDNEESARRFEMVSGLTLAFLAATLSVADLGAGKYGDDEIIGTAEKSNTYSWLQSKSIKQTIVEEQSALLGGLLEAGVIAPAQQAAVTARIEKMKEEIERYDKEKTELRLGSKGVGEANWVLEVDGEKGKVKGGAEWDETLAILGRAGEVFDESTLWLQLSLVIGSVSLLLNDPRMKWLFYVATVALGAIGGWFMFAAYEIAWTA
jgi:hypothetical protein